MTDTEQHGMTRRQLLRHTAWFGSAVVLTVVGGEVISQIGDASAPAAAENANALRFVQISDSHIGFTGPANTMVEQSFAEAINDINALPYRPDFVMHTGDLTHLSTPDQFDQVKQMMSGLKTGQVYTVPGEHDSVDDHGAHYRQFFAKGTKGDGWYSFDLGGVHFISLVNTLGLETMGHLGTDQLEFVR
ncbi:MAG TPA: metallophosphoesterase, partial [Pseudonocardiaceae bacterium]